MSGIRTRAFPPENPVAPTARSERTEPPRESVIAVPAGGATMVAPVAEASVPLPAPTKLSRLVVEIDSL